MNLKFYLTNFKKTSATFLFVIALVFFAGITNAQVYINGPLSTGATSSTGTAAPAGTTWSEVQGTNLNAGFGANIAAGLTVADNFTVCGSWNITKITFYAYSTGYAGATSPFNDVRIKIYNTDPSVGSPAPIYGDLTTNRFAASSFTNMYRVFAGGPFDLTRRIWAVEANVTTTLTSGNYWIEWQLGNGGLSNFSPPVTVVGATTQAGWNAKQNTLPNSWVNLVDGTPAGPQDMPFRIDYTTAACAGTPAPGNTIASATAICPGNTVSLSLQNCTPGSGVTYQWQSASAVGGPYSNIAGATNPTYSASPTTATFYQAVVTCGGNNGTSTPVGVTINPPSACYCVPPVSDCTDGDIITNVTLGTLNNTSTCSGTGYTNYTTNSSIAVPDVIIGGLNPITITAGTGTYTESVALWIDYNRNGSFEASEFTLIGTGATPIIRNGNINVPTGLTAGPARMRVRVQFSAAITSGGAWTASYLGYGETEDYTVNLVPCVPATISTQPTNKTVVCGASTTFTVGLAGSLPSGYWQWRPNATGLWNAVPAAAPYSGVNTTTLTINPATASLNGYQYRFVYQGACAGTDFSTPATLTVSPYVATVAPTSANICLGSIQKLDITNTLGDITIWTENFDVLSPIPAGWVRKNNSEPLGPQEWQQGSPADFPAFNGAPESYLMALWSSTTTTGSGTISNWLFTPQTTFKNGDQFKFYTRTAPGSTWADRMEVRISTAGASTNVGTTSTSVGDFTTVLLTINQSLTATGYPQTWTEYTATVSGVTGSVSGRAAFRYFVTDGGGNAPNSNVVGLDNVRFIQTGATATGVWTGAAGTMFTDATASTAYTGTPVSTIYVKPTVSGINNYSVVVTTPTCVSAAVTIPVNTRELPSSLSAVANHAICETGSTAFTSTVTGGFPSGLQWQVSTDNGANYSNVANNAVYGGATTGTLTITHATNNMNNYRYRLVASATPCAGTVTSAAGILTVNPLPVLTLTTTASSIYPGQTATLTATSSTTVPAGGYTWTRNGVIVPGATGNTLVVDVDALGEYTVSVADANGCGNAVPASITITDAPNDIMFIYPSPNTGQFQIRYHSAAGNNPLPRIVNIYDSKGARVYSKTYTVSVPYTRMVVDMSGFQKGIYQVELADRNGKRIKTGRVVIL